ncbi:hypothetical protein CE91St62_38440 [Lachnospiraceae bacterium]|uniref:DUF6147 family protein n=1 Tax=Extibacter sp. GGCC_0201 TaxID=2731209 RepID=UPI001AA0FB91|nr:DUF6147 family protein [Extibacter sp. GGCC_0201]MBO1719821.1 hypothetical protein [Extibacter sp. GGCC_0201]BDF35781.1 hypothetical protein CE91St61_38560 [Lachnospiraceae bacterium]BDF39783.1 hypothetical protein CE91St62_38440 [Lachnospiraceae bacterium]
MKKKIISMCSTLILFLSLLVANVTDTKASSDIPIVDGSYLTYDNESIGYAMKTTRGIDLLNGYSKVVRLGPGSIYAGGTTVAAHTVDKVKIAVIIERIAGENGSWEYCANWEKENLNADRVSANRQVTVEGGYYYRVRCIHSANNDVSSSFTNGIFIEEP